MYEPLRRGVLALLKVPADPHPPVGAPGSLRVFRAGRNYYKLRLAGWAATQVFVFAALLFWTAILIGVEAGVHERQAATPAPRPAREKMADAGPNSTKGSEGENARGGTVARDQSEFRRFMEGFFAAAKNVEPGKRGEKSRGLRAWIASYKQFCVELALLLPSWVFPLIWVLKILSFTAYLVQLPLTYAVRRLDYEMRWYMVTDRSLRLQQGVWKISESTMSFANIQQVTVTEGPLQRLLGMADLKVQSAGGGSKSHPHEPDKESMHVAVFRHVTQAREIRDLILDRLRRFRESGMGDPDEALAPSPDAPAVVDPPVAAARELLAEARALRSAVSS